MKEVFEKTDFIMITFVISTGKLSRTPKIITELAQIKRSENSPDYLNTEHLVPVFCPQVFQHECVTYELLELPASVSASDSNRW